MPRVSPGSNDSSLQEFVERGEPEPVLLLLVVDMRLHTLIERTKEIHVEPASETLLLKQGLVIIRVWERHWESTALIQWQMLGCQ